MGRLGRWGVHVFSVAGSGKIDKMTKKKVRTSSKITPEFKEWVEKSLDEDAEAMAELASWTDKFLKENAKAMKELADL